MSNAVGLSMITLGILFNFFGCVGLVRLPDIYNRLQASTKCVTLGTSLVLMGVVFMNGFCSISMKAILCMIFILVTSPTAAHAISKGAYLSGVELWEGSVVDQYKAHVKEEER
ncbi:MAG: Na+/H+ antiporter subunit G [Candidatus Omnitrophica bacterium]|nr:Na+/H+ antiporter subunit G [Candidatus Omnitrophota bacterium]